MKNTNIFKLIEVPRLRWAVHLIGMKEKEIKKKRILLQLGGQRRREGKIAADGWTEQ